MVNSWVVGAPRKGVMPMTVAEGLMLMISFGALIVAIMSDKNNKK
ncbi:putative holin-like toxin [Oceanobacillus sp. J11TS1]|nr:putative holin-like toxin [Oceanobacillus sp. J11TS1]